MHQQRNLRYFDRMKKTFALLFIGSMLTFAACQVKPKTDGATDDTTAAMSTDTTTMATDTAAATSTDSISPTTDTTN